MPIPPKGRSVALMSNTFVVVEVAFVVVGFVSVAKAVAAKLASTTAEIVIRSRVSALVFLSVLFHLLFN